MKLISAVCICMRVLLDYCINYFLLWVVISSLQNIILEKCQFIFSTVYTVNGITTSSCWPRKSFLVLATREKGSTLTISFCRWMFLKCPQFSSETYSHAYTFLRNLDKEKRKDEKDLLRYLKLSTYFPWKCCYLVKWVITRGTLGWMPNTLILWRSDWHQIAPVQVSLFPHKGLVPVACLDWGH